VLNINVSLQFADTIILNIGTQLVQCTWIYNAGLDVCPRCILKYGKLFKYRPTLGNWHLTLLLT